MVFVAATILRHFGLNAFIDDFRDNRAVITNINIGANVDRVGRMAILKARSKINVGIV